MKKVAIMQPYFMPYLGYWQLIKDVDEFVIYDNIEYTKKGWFNRNRILEIDHPRLFTIPLKNDSDFLKVKDRSLSDNSKPEIQKILRFIQTNYRKAPYYHLAYPVIEKCFLFSNKNLFDYIYNSVSKICSHLSIDTNIVVSSQVPVDHTLKAEKKVIAICKALDADTYINTIGGVELYDKSVFKSNGLNLQFIKSKLPEYKQFRKEFIPGLSIIDIMMFNDTGAIKGMLEQYELI